MERNKTRFSLCMPEVKNEYYHISETKKTFKQNKKKQKVQNMIFIKHAKRRKDAFIRKK